ncbi:MAG TPA: Ig-like domain-containing protein, partial [Thermoplasmata archaeon]|nr:Ig-like domain-containing protein [Thermoplasmata archaeon]
KGAAGNGPPAQTSTAAGWNLVGNASFTTVMTIENGTLTSTGDYDLIVNDFVTGTTINTSLSESRLVMATFGTLTVKNFLGVHVYWPNGVSPVPGASILVEDEGTPVWNFASPTGLESWLLVTDRVYEGAIPARENRTDVTVTYLAYNFASDPRSVDMSVGNTQPFVMVDRTPPSATTSPLPTYENALTFTIPYTASDGNGVGIGNVTLWWRQGGGWTPYVTQPGGPTGTFSFTASSGDGTYEFAATADDLAGNQEANPNTNESWTIVDTVRPGSHVNPQPTWHNTATFLVSWGPDNGVTDIATYEIQYNHAGAGWTPWMVVTASVTSAMFTANPAWGVYEFRSKARDVAGNYEIPPAGNDTWTIVDTEPPGSNVLALPTYETSLTFPVSWDRVGDAYDIATFRIEVKDNAGAWSVWIASTPNRTANYTGVDGHTYQFRSIATDYAGNVEPTPSGNDTWTTVDVTAPDSAVAGLPQYTTSTSWTLSWGPVAGTTDIVSYTIQYSDNGGAWTSVPGAVGVTATTILFALGADAHTFAFRALATDRAGNVEAAPPTNDTWTLVDTTRPFVVVSAPRGSGTNTTPLIVITFSEPMNRASVQAAFSITPDINGAFSWTADSRTMTFIPARALQASTDYFVAIDSSAKDVAGNTMQTAHTFQFTTAAPIVPPATSGGVGDWWWLIAVIVAAVAGSLFVAMRLLRGRATPEPIAAAKKEGPATIDDVFLLYHDGILIKHETRRLKPDIDTDILSGMLTAVQSFVKDSFRTEDGELDELTFGAMHILIARGKWLILAAMVQGDGTVAMRGQIEKCVQDMEANQGPAIEAWDGNMTFAKVLSPYIKKLIRGDYA